jgi:hypothetical protein
MFVASKRNVAAHPFDKWKEQQKKHRRKQEQNRDSLASVSHWSGHLKMILYLQLFASRGV